MTDFEPQTDLPDRIEDDDDPVESSARIRDAAVQSRRRWTIRIGIVMAGIALVAIGFPWGRVLIAMALMYLVLGVGLKMLGAFARPIPEPPPRGELRRVKLTYRCPSCGTELRMTLADDVVPQAPRHCADEMELTTPAEDL
ncbi:MAG: hypothetical protein AAF467_06255 [Actinomycetota bacterium]